MIRTFISRLGGFLVVLMAVCGGWAFAGSPDADLRSDMAGPVQIERRPDGRVRGVFSQSRSPVTGGSQNLTNSRETALAFAMRHRAELTGGGEHTSFRVLSCRAVSGKRHVLRLAQSYQGIPVYAAGLVLHLDGVGRVIYILADLLGSAPDLDRGVTPLRPAISLDAAVREAILQCAGREMSDNRLKATSTEVVLFDPRVVGRKGVPRLAWRVELHGGEIHEEVLIDARSGTVLFRVPLVFTGLRRMVYDARHENVDPGYPLRAEGEPATGISDADLLYEYMSDVYAFYMNTHGRDGFDDSGSTLTGTVRYPNNNASWNPFLRRMRFSEGFVTDDVVAHELTHGVTFLESGLLYAGQAGALNESFSDMWGEWVDLTNGRGNDSPEVRWLIGEDLGTTSGAVRDMRDPTRFGDPDRMGSPFWYEGDEDQGGVHTNSGVGNKLAFLLTDGGEFSGQTVFGMGVERAAQLFYETQTQLLSFASDYEDLYVAASQAAVNQGWTESERANLSRAFRAVEIRPHGPFNFSVRSRVGSSMVALSWQDPAQEGVERYVVRAASDAPPGDPLSSGTLLYDGPGTTTLAGPLTPGVSYHFAVWALYRENEASAPQRARATVGEAMEDFFTEMFDDGEDAVHLNDLAYRSVTFTPNDSRDGYHASAIPVRDFPSGISGGIPFGLTDDDSFEIFLKEGHRVHLYGQEYSSFHVGSNGYISFGEADTWMEESLANHFDRPRISALYDDLDPGEQGAMFYHETEECVVVSWLDVPEWNEENRNTFQVELFYDGRIRITWLRIDAPDGLAGLSRGGGTPDAFCRSDLTTYITRFDPFQNLNVDSDTSFFAAAWNLSTGEYPWGPTLDGVSDTSLPFVLLSDQWVGVVLYDYDAGTISATVFFYRQ